MNPWNIIGWFVVLVVAGCGAAIAGAFVVGLLIAMARRKRALRTAPAEGQVWMQDERRLYINEVRDGRVFIKTDCASWSDSIAEWKNRVRNRNLTLVHEA